MELKCDLCRVELGGSLSCGVWSVECGVWSVGWDGIVIWVMALASLEALYGPNKLPSKQASYDVHCGDSHREPPLTLECTGLLMLEYSCRAAGSAVTNKFASAEGKSPQHQ